MKNREDEDRRAGVRTLVLMALLMLYGLAIWAPWSELEETISRTAIAAASR